MLMWAENAFLVPDQEYQGRGQRCPEEPALATAGSRAETGGGAGFEALTHPFRVYFLRAGRLAAKDEQIATGICRCFIAADTVYLKESHGALLSTIRRLLKPRGSVLLMASRRNGSLDTFIAAANTGVAAFPFVGVSVDWEGSVAISSMKCAPVLVRMASPVVANATTATSSCTT